MERTNTLELTKGELFWHYVIFLIPLYIGLLDFYNFFKGGNNRRLLTSGTFWTSLAIFIFILKLRRLNFKRIELSLNKDEFKEKMQEIAENENWGLSKNTEKYAIVHAGSDLTWGLRITVLRFENYLLINSICEPDVACISILNENTRNLKKIRKHLTNASG